MLIIYKCNSCGMATALPHKKFPPKMNHHLPPSDPTYSDRERHEMALAARGPHDETVIQNTNIWGYLQSIGISDGGSPLLTFESRSSAHAVDITYSTRDGEFIGKDTLIFFRRADDTSAFLRNQCNKMKVLVNNQEVKKDEGYALEGEERIQILRGSTGALLYEFIYRNAQAESTIGEIFEYYYLGNIIGNGGYANVFSAVHRLSGTYYAVKKITRLTNNPSYEISCLESFNHPNICQLKEVFFHRDDSIYLVMELCREGNLLDYIRKSGYLSESVARDITSQICSTMAYIHSHGVVHRDLKPENILIGSLDPLRIKITDFGMAKSPDLHGILRSTKGSRMYIAPEVFGRQNRYEAYDDRVDTWSVGVIVVAMLTGCAPYRRRSTPNWKNEPFIIRISGRKLTLKNLEEQGYGKESAAFQFVESLLREDPKNRPMITEALQHPWLIESHD